MNERARETEVREHFFGDDGRIWNNPSLGLLVYRQALEEKDREISECRSLLAENGWDGAWVDGVFPYHHYHSNAHEVLCVVDGGARIAFGGPEGEIIEVEAGDVAVIPAGVGHCNLGSVGGFAVIGAYPRGQKSYDLRTGEEGERPEVIENIRSVALPENDPLFGEDGPLFRYWTT